MRVKCIANSLGRARFGIDLGREYLVLALEAYAGDPAWLPPGLMVFVGRENGHAHVPISCLEIVDPNAGRGWQVGRVHDRWLIGYPFMLSEAFQIGLERGDDPEFRKKYRELLRHALDDSK